MNPIVDEKIQKAKKWKEEIQLLRSILADTELLEELKWYQPCYTLNKKNVIIIGSFKDYCTLTFFKGVLINDDAKILHQPGENTQSARYIRITSKQEIEQLEPTIKKYIQEAIQIEKIGAKVSFKPISERSIPSELQSFFKKDSSFESAFQQLTPGRQRAYLLYFSAAKQSKTILSRIEKYYQKILLGKGIND